MTSDVGRRDGAAPLDAAGLDAATMDLGMAPTDGATPDAFVPPTPDDVSAACPSDLCWMAGGLSPFCGSFTTDEDFGSGRYGAHEYGSRLRAEVVTTYTLQRTGGSWQPALLVLDGSGATLHDGRTGLSSGPIRVSAITSGESGTEASFTIVADTDVDVRIIVTSWANRAADFSTMLPTEASYDLSVAAECEDDRLLTPPNFDESDTAGGYYLLPPADPSGLYTRKADDCSRGTRLLIQVLYTAAYRWREARPDLPALAMRDLNEGSCSTVDHATHDDGTHADVVVECGTQVSCTDDSAAITLGRIFVDTGSVCGILFNDTAVQSEVNDYFFESYSYEPWDPSGAGRFMRTVSGHTGHFHVRVFKPDGTCN